MRNKEKLSVPSCGKTYIKVSKVIWPHPDHVEASTLNADVRPRDGRMAPLLVYSNGTDGWGVRADCLVPVPRQLLNNLYIIPHYMNTT